MGFTSRIRPASPNAESHRTVSGQCLRAICKSRASDNLVGILRVAEQGIQREPLILPVPRLKDNIDFRVQCPLQEVATMGGSLEDLVAAGSVRTWGVRGDIVCICVLVLVFVVVVIVVVVVGWLLFAVCLLFVVCCLLCGVCCLLVVVCCLLFVVLLVVVCCLCSRRH